MCEDIGRDPATLGKSIGVAVAPPGAEPTGLLGDEEPIFGSVDEIADSFNRSAEMGGTRLEMMAAGDQRQTIEALAPIIERLG